MVITDRMELPQAPDDVFAFITDLDAVAPCVPGAKLDPPAADQPAGGARDGEVVFAFGPIRYRYRGTIRITARDAAARTVSYDAAGTETSGEGTLGVEMTLRVDDGGAGGSSLDVVAEAALTGMVADYGQAMAEEIAKDIISQFVRAVRGRDLGPSVSSATTPAADGGESAHPAPAAARPIGGFRLLWRVTLRRLTRVFRRSRATSGRNAG